jgi:hypothetical protein
VFSFFALLEVPSFWMPNKGGAIALVLAGGIVAGCAVLAVRGLRSGIEVTEAFVICRSLVRTRRWPVSIVQRFEVRPGRVGYMSYRRLVLWIVLTNDPAIRLEVLNWSPRVSPASRMGPPG